MVWASGRCDRYDGPAAVPVAVRYAPRIRTEGLPWPRRVEADMR
jgi:hypothetical protein